MIGVYKITNLVNGNSYIGISTNIEERWKYHRKPSSWNGREANKTLYKAFKKYGIENFSFDVLEECAPNMLSEKEKYYISLYNTYEAGYNETTGGEDYKYDGHPRHKLTKADVIDIRIRYNNLERREQVYQLYKDKIGESGFGKIWKGETW